VKKQYKKPTHSQGMRIMSIHSKLSKIQNALNAPKDMRNDFAKFNYRSNEGILQALKPHLTENGLSLIVSDKMVDVGGRVYVEATTVLTCVETGESVFSTASAREPLTRKGMDDSQITGAASSYARKYCLNALFAIDDNKDADSMAAPVITLSDGEINAFIKQINVSVDMDGLKAVYGKAMAACAAVNDLDARAAIVKAKDNHKSTITAAMNDE